MNQGTMNSCVMHESNVKVKGQGHQANTYVKLLRLVTSVIITIRAQSLCRNVWSEMLYNFLIGFIHVIFHLNQLISDTLNFHTFDYNYTNNLQVLMIFTMMINDMKFYAMCHDSFVWVKGQGHTENCLKPEVCSALTTEA